MLALTSLCIGGYWQVQLTLPWPSVHTPVLRRKSVQRCTLVQNSPKEVVILDLLCMLGISAIFCLLEHLHCLLGNCLSILDSFGQSLEHFCVRRRQFLKQIFSGKCWAMPALSGSSTVPFMGRDAQKFLTSGEEG